MKWLPKRLKWPPRGKFTLCYLFIYKVFIKGKREEIQSFIKQKMRNIENEVRCVSHFSMSKSAITKIQVAIIAVIIVVAAAAGAYYYLVTQKPGRKTLRVFEWGGYEDPKLWNVGESAFKTMYPDVDVEFSFFVDSSEALSKLKLGFKPDLVHPCGGDIQRYYDAGVIEPLDPSLIPNWQNMTDPLKHYAEVEETPVEGEVYLAPCDWGYSTVLYRPDLLEQLGIPKEDWDTFNLLFREDEKLSEKIMVMDSAVEVTPMAALAAGVPPDEIWNMTDTQMEMTRAKLLYQKLNLIRGYWTVPTQVVSAMASGEVVAANIWGESYATLKAMGVNVT
ncbi:MAG: extracellular solute-binding protein, partial [Candidatus Bathyarchaeota archaeon]|nr:extracellular solute-binding protein [Candidatus Bathyarchaeota archaeon]